jgi:hypothetical protein
LHFTRAKPCCRSPPYQVRGRLHPDNGKSPARCKAARNHTAVRNVHHKVLEDDLIKEYEAADNY